MTLPAAPSVIQYNPLQNLKRGTTKHQHSSQPDSTYMNSNSPQAYLNLLLYDESCCGYLFDSRDHTWEPQKRTKHHIMFDPESNQLNTHACPINDEKNTVYLLFFNSEIHENRIAPISTFFWPIWLTWRQINHQISSY